MHKEAYEYCQKHADDLPGWAIDIGGHNVNGTARNLWPNRHWAIIDPQLPTTETADDSVATYIQKDVLDVTDDEFIVVPDLIICTEVFEHTPSWPLIIHWVHRRLSFWTRNAQRRPVVPEFIITCAGPYREPHSSLDGGELKEDEYYRAIHPDELDRMLSHYGFREYEIDENKDIGDVYAHAVLK